MLLENHILRISLSFPILEIDFAIIRLLNELPAHKQRGRRIDSEFHDLVVCLSDIILDSLHLQFDGLSVSAKIAASGPKLFFLSFQCSNEMISLPFKIMQVLLSFCQSLVKSSDLCFYIFVRNIIIALGECFNCFCFSSDDLINMPDRALNRRNADCGFDGCFDLLKRGVICQLGDLLIIEEEETSNTKGENFFDIIVPVTAKIAVFSTILFNKNLGFDFSVPYRPTSLNTVLFVFVKGQGNGHKGHIVCGVLVDMIQEKLFVGISFFLNISNGLLAVEGQQDGIVKGRFAASVQTADQGDISVTNLIGQAHLMGTLVDAEIMQFNSGKIHTSTPQSTRSSGSNSSIMPARRLSRASAICSASSSSR